MIADERNSRHLLILTDNGIVNTGDYCNNRISDAVARFSGYIEQMQSLISDAYDIENSGIAGNLLSGILNGEVTLALQSLVPLKIRKEGLRLSSLVVSLLKELRIT